MVILTVTLSLATALSYGVSDFFGAVGARRLRVLPGTTITYVVAMVTILAALPIVGGAWSAQTVLWGALAGVAAIAGFLVFYAALAAGPMSVAAPLIAVLSSLVPVVVAVVLGERLSRLAWGAIVVALAGAGLISVTRRGEPIAIPRKTVVLVVLAGVLLGASIVFLDRTPQDSGVTSAVVEIVVGVLLTGVLLLVARSAPGGRMLAMLDEQHDGPQPSVARARVASAVGGVLLGVANAMLLAALQSGSLAVVSVLVGLYPVATIVLARIVHRERLTRVQLAGVVLAIAACALLAAA